MPQALNILENFQNYVISKHKFSTKSEHLKFYELKIYSKTLQNIKLMDNRIYFQYLKFTSKKSGMVQNFISGMVHKMIAL